MQTQKFDELISYFNCKVAEMNIDIKYKMELLGMVTVLGFTHEKELTAQSEQPEQHWIPVKERNPIEYDNPIEFIATLEDPSGERYVEFIEWDGYKWDDFYTDDNERGVWGYDKVIAWTKKPEPFKGDLNE